MKKALFSALLSLALLCGCGGNPEPKLDRPPAEVEAVSLPEPRRLEPIFAPAVVTEGRTPAEEYTLPPLPQEAEWEAYRQNMERWVTSPGLAVLAEARAADAAFIALPLYANSHGTTALIRWKDSLAEFDWMFSSGPSIVLPQLFCFDVDGDREDELMVICHVGSGTEVSIDELHILEKGPDGSLTDYAFPESLWTEQLPALFDTAEINGRTFAVLGHELVEFGQEELDLETASPGLIANFILDGESLSFRGSFCLCPPNSGIPRHVAKTSAQILYQDGMFALQDFHLYSYDQ